MALHPVLLMDRMGIRNMSRTTQLATLLILGGAVWPNMVDAQALKPLAPERFLVTPHEPAVLRWQVET